VALGVPLVANGFFSSVDSRFVDAFSLGTVEATTNGREFALLPVIPIPLTKEETEMVGMSYVAVEIHVAGNGARR